MSKPESKSELIAGLAEEFVARYRNGERPPISEYTARRPELAREIREFFEAVALIENLAPVDSRTVTGPEHDGPDPGSERLDRLGDYRIIREVGRGGMGVVYEAEQLSLGRHVALKVLPAQLLVDDKQRLRFEREAKAAARLHHTNIVPVFGVGHEAGTHYYVMQFIQGKGLDQVLDDLRQLRLQRLLASGAGGRESLGASSVSALGDAPAAALAKSLLDGRFHETLIDPEFSELGVDASSEDALPTHCCGGSPVTPPDEQTSAQQPSMGSQTASQATEPGSLPTDRGSASDGPTGSVKGLPTRHDRSSGFLLPTDSNSASSSKSRLPTYWESVARIGTQIASALQYAHGQGVLHRDIKPSNLLLDLRATVWITDFGLAKADDQENLTHTGDVLGTLRYMPPEAFDGKTDQRSDLYALGLTLYELLAFRPAFDERDRRKLIQQVTEANPVRLERIDKSIPRDLATIVHKAIEREPAHRYQTGQELADDLQRFLNDEPIHARRISSIERFVRWRRRNRGLAAATMSVAALLVAVAIGCALAVGIFSGLNRDLRATVEENGRVQRRLEAARLEAETAEQEAIVARRDADEQKDRAIQSSRQAQTRAEEREIARKEATLQLYLSRVQMAYQASHDSLGFHRAAELLESVRPGAGEDDLRGWEWYFVKSLQHRESLRIGEENVMSRDVEFVRGGQLIATLGDSTPPRLFDVKTGQLVRRFAGDLPNEQFDDFEWRPDGSQFAVLGDALRLQIWDVAAGRAVAEFGLTNSKSPDNKSRFFSYSADGKYIVTIVAGILRVWDSETLGLVAQQETGIATACLSPDNTGLVVYDSEKVRRFEFPSLQVLWSRANTDGGAPAVKYPFVAWSPNGRFIAMRTTTGVVLRHPDNGKFLTALRLPGIAATDFRISPNGEQIVAAGTGGSLHVIDATDGSTICEFRGHSDSILGFTIHPDGLMFASASSDGTRLWTADSSGDVIRLGQSGRRVFGMEWNTDGSQIATLEEPDVCRIYDSQTHKPIREFRFSGAARGRLAWHPRQNWLLCVALEAKAELVDVSTGELLALPDEIATNCHAAGWSPDGTQLATAVRDVESLTLWEVDGWKPVAQLRHGASMPIDRLSWSPTGQWLATYALDPRTAGAHRVWDLNNQKVVTAVGWGRQSALSWSKRGEFVAIAREKIGWILRTGTWQQEGELIGHGGGCSSIDWSPDDSRICTGSPDGTVRIWDGKRFSELLTLRQGGASIVDTRWSPDSLQLAWHDSNGALWLANAREAMERELSPRLTRALDTAVHQNPRNFRAIAQRARLKRSLGALEAASQDTVQLEQHLHEQQNSADDAAELENTADELAQLQLQRRSAGWTVWHPEHVSLCGGQPWFRQKDGSLFVDLSDIKNESYFLSDRRRCDE